MSALDFMSPDRARTDGGFAPVARSPIERSQRDAGATFAERDGWLVPVAFDGEAERLASVGIADISHYGKIEVRGPGTRPDAREIVAWYDVRPGVALVLCEQRDAFVLRSSLARRYPHVLDQTGAYAMLALVGPSATSLLRRLTHLHELPSSGSLAHVLAHVLPRDGGYWVLVLQEYGRYVWEVAVDAAEQLGGGPVGVDAIQGGRA